MSVTQSSGNLEYPQTYPSAPITARLVNRLCFRMESFCAARNKRAHTVLCVALTTLCETLIQTQKLQLADCPLTARLSRPRSPVLSTVHLLQKLEFP